MTDNTEKTNAEKAAENKGDTLAFIIGGIFILGLVFATYNYFTKEGVETMEDGEKQERKLSLEELKETLSTSTEEEKEESEKADVAEKTEEAVAGDTTAIETTGNNDAASTEPAWTANDYSKGDVTTGDYTVKSGDTLWEIAEAAYGDGSMWTKIRDANSANVDYLPSGQQALIYAGQTLNIPA
ncbi:LysM peptidoglycan-binding domain-containing protein [candidate division WWE3 bacterium]|nr:LysM peptidoglycan-binding domain-containing protein [candidate division WWE3 bacterium]